MYLFEGGFFGFILEKYCLKYLWKETNLSSNQIEHLINVWYIWIHFLFSIFYIYIYILFIKARIV